MSQILVPVSFGELIDKITILEIKAEKLQDPNKLANVRHELQQLRAVLDQSGLDQAKIALDWAELKQVNAGLWDVEDGKRDKESKGEFDAAFIALARRVYFENDQRAAIKRRINLALGSDIVEEKSYRQYATTASLSP